MSFLGKVKDWFTDVLGAILMVLGLYLSYKSKIEFVWTGIAMILAGFILMSIPDKEIAEAVKNWAKKKWGNDE